MDQEVNNIDTEVVPFLKWAGGKRWFAQDFSDIFPSDFNTYFEPFLGSGAVFFHLNPSKSVLSDLNEELINSYIQVRDNWERIEKDLKSYHRKHSKEFYYETRSYKPRISMNRAVRFIYLNRTCWNGLYRVNLKGEFNVPVGSKKNVVLDTDNFYDLSKRLKKSTLIVCDFERTIDKSESGDFIFIDPPYTVKHNMNGFVKYNEKIFTWDDQVRLKNAIERASLRGVKFLLTNAYHESIRDLYHGLGEFLEVERASVISGKATARGRYSELIIRNY
ncbi:MAG: DNA methyltransferase [Oceanospirillaceae bacterium]|nr:DNA methyltransferase [Oceanospirillaceae bacterium]|tara:strand:- start:1075 stop:1902 length:828 start_codon:yes stop_codon:yes gene_type:complete